MTIKRGEGVVMTHSGTNATIIVSRSAVPVHMASGWVPEDTTVAKEEKGNVPTDVAPATQDAAEGAKSNTTKRTAKES